MPDTVYLAGPMRGIPDWNFPAFDTAAAHLRQHGWNVISPAELDRARGITETSVTVDFPAAIRVDIEALLQCDAIYLLQGWERSVGARFERHMADVLGLAVHYQPGATEADLTIGYRPKIQPIATATKVRKRRAA